ncbi:MAG: formimidoylglutamate deiminase [Thermomicrobiales bacterium]
MDDGRNPVETIVTAGRALLADGWARDVRLTLADGRIAAIGTGVPAGPADRHNHYEVVIPGLPNLHSHAFQRGMAGLAETRGDRSAGGTSRGADSGADTFWTWRKVMYRFALAMSPEQMEAVARLAYIEMLESGFTRVGEFHYLHHAPDGVPYDDPAEMASRIVAAAVATGIGLTLLPVFYAHATFGGADPEPHQRRFICDLPLFARMMQQCRALVADLPEGVLGVAPHSLRAVTPEELLEIATLVPEGPVHIHAAEQVKEVEDCLAWSGQRPVAWLLGHAGIDHRWCLIHATHLDAGEVTGLAASGAVAGLCPVTEANLGDGIFPGKDFAARGGRYGVGTDSNVQIGAAAELRQLEYAQRLAARERNVLAGAHPSTGRSLLDAAVRGGTQALRGLDVPAGLEVGGPADFVSLDVSAAPPVEGDAILDAWIFAGLGRVEDVWVQGRRWVAQGRHLGRDAIAARYRQVIADLVRE